MDQNGCHFFPRFGCPFHQRTYFHESPKHCYIIVSFHQMNLDVKEYEYALMVELDKEMDQGYFYEQCLVSSIQWHGSHRCRLFFLGRHR